MSFFGKTFLFDGIPSETYGLYITTPDGGESFSAGGSDVEPILEKIYRRPKPYIFGVEQSPTLSFPVEFFSYTPIDANASTIIERWLFGQLQYKKLAIVQNDIQPIYFTCFLRNPQKRIINNLIYGYGCEVQCDAPWGWTNQKTKTYTYTTDDVLDYKTINIQTDNNYYTYPTISFTTNVLGGRIYIINQSDNNREFGFTDLIGNETVTVNNDLGIITSSSGFLRAGNFNKNFFRFVKGNNVLEIGGNISSLSFSYQLAKKIGG